jgi:hypothetical protein
MIKNHISQVPKHYRIQNMRILLTLKEVRFQPQITFRPKPLHNIKPYHTLNNLLQVKSQSGH